MKTGLYHAYRQAVAPTGSISYVADSTSSIHPVPAAIETRKTGKIGRVYRAAPYLSDETAQFYRNAFEIGPTPLINIYAAATEHVDQGLSLTFFFNGDVTTREMNKAYIQAWVAGIKTQYYSRMKNIAVEGTELSGLANDAIKEICEACQV